MPTEVPFGSFLRGLAALEPELQAHDLLDALWLAAVLPRAPAEPPIQPPVQPPVPEPPQDGADKTEEKKPIGQAEPPRGPSKAGTGAPLPTPPDAPVELAVPAPLSLEAGPPAERGLRLAAPGAKALPNALALGRALRPLRRRIDSRTRFVLDDDATVETSAELRRLTPVLRPWRERWLDLALIIDTNPSMLAWQGAVRAFRLLCESAGPFRDVRSWRFDTSRPDRATLHTAQGRAARNAGELRDPTGRRVAVVVSDCLGPAWAKGTAAGFLAGLRHGLNVSILHLLPRWLWRQTALADAPIVQVKTAAAASPNARLAPRRSPDDDDDVPAEGLVLPLFTLEPDAVAAWADLLAGKPDPSAPAVVLTPGVPTAAWRHVESAGAARPTVPAAERMERFKRRGSAVAYRLAFPLAAVEPLRLPLMRLTQEAMLPESRQIHLAEVLHSGLLRRKPPAPGQVLTEETVEYEWEAGVLGWLLDRAPTGMIVEAHRRVSRYVREHLNIVSQFEAILRDPDGPDLVVPAEAKAFATVTANILQRLGSRYAEAGRRLATGALAAANGPVSVAPRDSENRPAEEPERGPDGFLTVEGIRRVGVPQFEAGNPDKVSTEVLMYKGTRLRTWLVATPGWLRIVQDRKTASGPEIRMHVIMGPALVFPLRFSVRGGSRLVQFGGDGERYSYSASLFPEPGRLEAAVRSLLGQAPPARDWTGRTLLVLTEGQPWREDPLVDSLRRTGAQVNVAGSGQRLFAELNSMSFDAIIVLSRDDSPAAGLPLLERIGRAADRMALVLFHEATPSRAAQSSARRFGALVCTSQIEEATQALDAHFQKPPGPFANRRILWIGEMFSRELEIRYQLEAEGARLLILRHSRWNPADLREAPFDSVVSQSGEFEKIGVEQQTAALMEALRGAGRNEPLVIFDPRVGRKIEPGSRDRTLAVTGDPDLLRGLLACCAVTDRLKLLDLPQALRFVERAVALMPLPAMLDILRLPDSNYAGPLSSDESSPEAIAKVVGELCAAVCQPCGVQIVRLTDDGETEVWSNLQTPLPEASPEPLVQKDYRSVWERPLSRVPQSMLRAMLRQERPPASRWEQGPRVGSFARSEWLEIRPSPEADAWGAVLFHAMEPGGLYYRTREWLRAVVRLLDRRIALAEDTSAARGRQNEMAFQRGTDFLVERGTDAETAAKLIRQPSSPEWQEHFRRFATETELVTEFMALVAAMWQPRRWELWVDDRGGLRFVTGSKSQGREPVRAVRDALDQGGTSYVPHDAAARPTERCRLGLPITWTGQGRPWGYVGLSHSRPDALEAARPWIADLISGGAKTLQEMEQTWTIRAELDCSPVLLKRLVALRRADPVRRQAVIARTLRRALPLFLIGPSVPPSFQVAAMRLEAVLERSVPARPPGPPLHATVMREAVRSFARSDREKDWPVMVWEILHHAISALAAQGALCVLHDELRVFLRDFLFLCSEVASMANEPALRFAPNGWSVEFDRMLGHDLTRSGIIDPLWGRDDPSPWAIQSSATPAKTVLVVGLSLSSLPKPAAEACQRLGHSLARLGHNLVVGCLPGVDEAVTVAFIEARADLSRLMQVVKKGGHPFFEEGKRVSARNSEDSLKLRLADVDAVVLINGVEGTMRAAEAAEAAGLPVFPIAQTGGAALEYYLRLAERRPFGRAGTPTERFALLNEEVPAAIDLLFHVLQHWKWSAAPPSAAVSESGTTSAAGRSKTRPAKPTRKLPARKKK